MQRRLIVLEGVDDVGKTTIAKALKETYENTGEKTLQTSFPGRDQGTLGELVYAIHHAPSTYGLERPVLSISLQMLHVAAHMDQIYSRLVPALSRGELIILDRFWWSTWSYGRVDGIEREALKSILRIERDWWAANPPSAIILIERGPEPSGMRRALMEEYRTIAAQESKSLPVMKLQNDASVSSAAAKIRQFVESVI